MDNIASKAETTDVHQALSPWRPTLVARPVKGRLLVLLVVIACTLAACDAETPQSFTPTPPTGATPTATGRDTTQGEQSPTVSPIQPERSLPVETPVDAALVTSVPTPNPALPSPTAVTASGQGDAVSALSALPALRARALAWQADVRLAMLVNVRPGQQSKLLGVALGDPDVFEATPGGLGRNWTLVAVSPSRGAVAVSADKTLVDLTAEGSVTGEMIAGFTLPQLSALELSQLDTAPLKDTDAIWSQLGDPVTSNPVSMALLSPEGLGMGPLGNEGSESLLVYQLFSVQPGVQVFAIFDALSGRAILQDPAP